jgi:hypothetical protein
MPEQEITVENVESMQVMYINNFIDDNEIRDDFNLWLEANQHEQKDSSRHEVLIEFIEDMDFQRHYEEWLVLTFREDNDDKVTEDQIHQFVRLLEVK